MTKEAFPPWLSSKESACQSGATETQVPPLGWEHPLKENMATHSSILAWRIPGQRNMVEYSP